MAALKYWVWLTTLAGVSEDTRLRLLQAFSSPEDVYFADKGDLALVKDMKKEELAALENRSLDEAERILEKCGKKEIFVVTYADALYPQRLKNIYHPPLLLYGKGKMPLFDEEAAVAVVGTRGCTPYGIRCAQELGYEITQQGGMVISGMARGIDAAAMEGALASAALLAACWAAVWMWCIRRRTAVSTRMWRPQACSFPSIRRRWSREAGIFPIVTAL